MHSSFTIVSKIVDFNKPPLSKIELIGIVPMLVCILYVYCSVLVTDYHLLRFIVPIVGNLMTYIINPIMVGLLEL